ncbi:hypothetical protein FORC14_1993 [Vibrio parahaemolyticus]|nr:hypothetical protein FORC14_1993 [Vibrio parahaemolyticus]
MFRVIIGQALQFMTGCESAPNWKGRKMLEKLLNNNPLGVVMLCASIVGTGYVMNYRLNSIETTQQNIGTDVKDIRQDISALQADVAGLKAVADYKERAGK